MSEPLLRPDLSIVECGRSNIIPRNPPTLPRPGSAIRGRSSPGFSVLDDALTAILPVLAQNWFFVLRKQ
jgi:hypothetical protein